MSRHLGTLRGRLARPLFACAAAIAAAAVFPATPARAADHGDSPAIAPERGGADIADIFFFLDPNDNTQAVLVYTIAGFINPGEGNNFSVFDPNLRYRINIENTGDTKVDNTIDVTFSPKTTSAATPQTASVQFGRIRFTAPSTAPTLSGTARPQTITDGPQGIKFFAGPVDDPFFFDIPGFIRFVDSVRAGAPDVTTLQRGRDTFAGFNTLCIAFRMPVSLLKGPGNVVGVYVEADRRITQQLTSRGVVRGTGAYKVVDRMGNPAVNVVLVPFNRKNEYNVGTPRDDARGRFASDIVGTAQALGTNETNIGVLASVAVQNGDFLRLDVTRANTGTGGGDNAGSGFPNGRRLKDDVVDILTTIVANGTPLGDSVDGNDVPLQNTFPFVALPQQPREPGVIDDNTRS